MPYPTYLEVQAGVRYWEDACLNGQPDEEGTIPLRKGDLWCPLIELKTGKVVGWPEGLKAEVHYKVCDEGEYWLQDPRGARVAKWKSHYVPDAFLCPKSRGYGDYIILTIGEDGIIENWSAPFVDIQEWTVLNTPENPLAD